MIKVKEGLIPSNEKYMSAARPNAIPGKINGDIKNESATLDQPDLAEAIPRAAHVPINAAAPAAHAATSSVLNAAR
jgi:hypothetical protein